MPHSVDRRILILNSPILLMTFAQTDIFGNLNYDIKVTPMTRKIMGNDLATFKSHRLLMRAVAREMGFDWIDQLPSDQRAQLELLFDHSPDFERAARLVREENQRAARGLAHV